MRLRTFAYSIILALSCCLSKSVESIDRYKGTPGKFKKNDFHIYLLIGQSNMAGRGEIATADSIPLDSAYLFTGSGWEKAASPLNKYSSVRKRIDLQKMGPGYTFARKLSKSTGKGIGLVVNARGGSNIDQWQKGYNGSDDLDLYEEAVKRLKAARNDGVFKGILWHQGESNQSSTGTYTDKLKALVEDLRHDVGKDAFFVAGELGKWRESSYNFNGVIRSIADDIENSDYVITDGLRPINGDKSDPHFDGFSQRVLGGLYADKILKNVYHLTTGVAKVYSECNYKGYEVSFEIGVFTSAELAKRGIHNNEVASLKLDPGYEALLFLGRKRESALLLKESTDCIKALTATGEKTYIRIGLKNTLVIDR